MVRLGLVGCVWFSVFARAAHDLWASCTIFACLTFFTLLFMVDRFITHKPVRLPLALPSAFLLIAGSVSLTQSFNFAATRHELWILFFSLVAFYLFINSMESAEDVQRFFQRTSLVLIPLALICLYDQITGHPEGYAKIQLFSFILSYGHWEIAGTLISSILLSSFALFWGFYVLERPQRSPLTILLWLAFAIILILSRSSWAIVSLMGGMVFFESHKLVKLYHKQKKTILVIAMAAAALLLLVLFIKFGKHQNQHYSGFNRLTWWMAALRMFSECPWTGIGLGAFHTAYPYFRIPTAQATLYAHSSVLQIFAESGLLGSTAMILFFWTLATMVRRSPARTMQAPSQKAILAALVTVVISSLITISLEYFLTKFLIFLFLGALLTERQGAQVPIHRPLWLWPIAAVFITLLPYWLSPFQASRLYQSALAYDHLGDWEMSRSQFRDALSLDSHNGDLYAALAFSYQKSAIKNRSAQDYKLSRNYMLQAYRWKRDARYLSLLADESKPK